MNQLNKQSFPEVQLTTVDTTPTYKEIAEPLCKNKDIVARQKLNAAAPELLEALEKIESVFSQFILEDLDSPCGYPSIMKARAAIKKAKGE